MLKAIALATVATLATVGAAQANTDDEKRAMLFGMMSVATCKYDVDVKPAQVVVLAAAFQAHSANRQAYEAGVFAMQFATTDNPYICERLNKFAVAVFK